MRRRGFIAMAAAAAAWPALTRAQRTATPTIGFLLPASLDAHAPYLAGFRRGLGDMGYVEGRNVAVDYRAADNQPERLLPLAKELAGRGVSVLATGSATAAALAAKAATTTIPIVFAIGADPVKFGLVASLNRPGGNVTGATFRSNALVSKQFDLLRELAPGATTIGLLVNPDNPNAPSDRSEAEAAASVLGRRLHVAEVSRDSDIDGAVGTLVAAGAGALVVSPDVLFITARQPLVEAIQRRRLPCIYSSRVYAKVGGLVSYGADQTEAYRSIGVYTGRILKGERPSDLPVVQSDVFELVINLKTAKAIGIAIPPSLLARADEVIE